MNKNYLERKGIKICKRCLQISTRPKLYFDENSVCGACLWEETKKSIDWDERENELKKIVERAKDEAVKRVTYDCVCGVSGGKDSTFVVLYARDKLGLNCLLVNAAPAQQTEIGQHNLNNLLNLGFDMVTIKVNPVVLRNLIKHDFYKHLNISKPTEYPLWASSYQIALGYNIPLVIQGENPALTLGVRKGAHSLEGDASHGGSIDTRSSGNAFEVYGGIEGITEKDLLLYHFPNPKLIEEKNIESIFLQYYIREWSQWDNAEFAMKHSMKIRDDSLHHLGRIHKWTALDSDFHMVNQLFKYYKLGFGFAMDEVCYDIREGRLSRKEGERLIDLYDGNCGEEYIKKFCGYIGIDEFEFWKVVSDFATKCNIIQPEDMPLCNEGVIKFASNI